MIKNFLHIYQAIKAVINSSNSKAFKNKALILLDEELIYLKNIVTGRPERSGDLRSSIRGIG